MDSFFIALITFFSVAHLTFVFTHKEYKKSILFDFLKLYVAISALIVICVVIQASYEGLSGTAFLLYLLDNIWHYLLYMTVVQWFCLNISEKLSDN